MNIGIDIDGVLTDLERFVFNTSIGFFYQKGYKLENPKGSELADMFNIPKDLISEYWKEYIDEYFNKNPRPFSKEIIKKLRNEGNKIIIITSRGSNKDEEVLDNGETERITLNWLKKYDIEYDDIIFVKGNKLTECLNNNIDIMIEDMPKNLLNISKEIKCIVYNAIYNEDISDDNIIRCYSWQDIDIALHNL